MTESTTQTNVVTARFPKPALRRLQSALRELDCSRTELVVAGTMAEIERRLQTLPAESQPSTEHRQ